MPFGISGFLKIPTNNQLNKKRITDQRLKIAFNCLFNFEDLEAIERLSTIDKLQVGLKDQFVAIILNCNNQPEIIPIYYIELIIIFKKKTSDLSKTNSIVLVDFGSGVMFGEFE